MLPDARAKGVVVSPGASELRTWLLGITRNLCYRRGRNRIQEQEESGEPAEAPEIEAAMIRSETADA
jgi:DNA-directed RNA polymerase specialized sigma24 family protein